MNVQSPKFKCLYALLALFIWFQGMAIAQDDNDLGDPLDASGIPPEEMMDDPEPPPEPEPVSEPEPAPEPEPVPEPEPRDDPVDEEPRSSGNDDAYQGPDLNYGNRNDSDNSEGEEIKPLIVEEEKITPRKIYTEKQVKDFCRQYDGKVISYYSSVYRVESCTRREYLDYKIISALLVKGIEIHEVVSDVIAALPEGVPMDKTLVVKTARTCRDLEKKHVTHTSVEIFYVENCKTRIFPDFATYEDHRGDKRMNEIVDLSWLEFSSLEVGEPIPSILDEMYSKLLSGEAGVDIIPVDEACEGINGKVVSYYSRLYRIERCYKREILSPSMYTKEHNGFYGKEVSSQVWISLPDGEPIDNRPKEQAQK